MEALGAVLAPKRRREVIEEALDAAGASMLPTSSADLRLFVDGPLFAALARHLEVSDALELVHQVRGSMALALSEVEGAPISDIRNARRILSPAPQRVFVATAASLVVFLLQDVLGDTVEVFPAGDLSVLEDRIRRSPAQRLLVIIDRKHPCVDRGVTSLLTRELGEDSTVIWWGAPGSESRLVGEDLRGGPRVIPCGFDTSLADLSDICRTLLG